MATLYRFFNDKDELLYIGCSIQALVRIESHNKKPWFKESAKVTFTHYENKELALEHEKKAIEDEEPRYNITAAKNKDKPRVEIYKHVLRIISFEWISFEAQAHDYYWNTLKLMMDAGIVEKKTDAYRNYYRLRKNPNETDITKQVFDLPNKQ